MTPRRRGSPQTPLLGEASEFTVRPFVICKRCLTPSRPYAGSLVTGLIILFLRPPLHRFNFHGITTVLMSLTTCCSDREGVRPLLSSESPVSPPATPGEEALP